MKDVIVLRLALNPCVLDAGEDVTHVVRIEADIEVRSFDLWFGHAIVPIPDAIDADANPGLDLGAPGPRARHGQDAEVLIVADKAVGTFAAEFHTLRVGLRWGHVEAWNLAVLIDLIGITAQRVVHLL